jgi:hypothetical protein
MTDSDTKLHLDVVDLFQGGIIGTARPRSHSIT